MACVLPLCPLRLRIVGNTLPARTADLYEIAARRAGGFCVLEEIEQQDHSLRMRENAGADRTVERNVRRVTTALRPGSDAAIDQEQAYPQRQRLTLWISSELRHELRITQFSKVDVDRVTCKCDAPRAP